MIYSCQEIIKREPDQAFRSNTFFFQEIKGQKESIK